MKLVTTEFKSGELHEKHVVATWNSWESSQHLLLGTGKPRKTCVEVAGRRTFRILTSSQQSGIQSLKKKHCPHNTTNKHKITTHTRQLQQHTGSTKNHYTQENLKLATKTQTLGLIITVGFMGK